MKKITLLGSTGSIGESTLKIVEAFPDRFRVVGLAASTNVDRLYTQIQQFHAEVVAVSNVSKAKELKDKLKGQSVQILEGKEGVEQLAAEAQYDVLVNAIEAIGEGQGKIKVMVKELDKISIDIIDNGFGMDDNEVNSIFDEDFSTKEIGSGLGLVIVKRNVELHDGQIEIIEGAL